MATFESKFNIGDRVCFLDSIIQWANGTKDEAKVSEIRNIEILTNGGVTTVKYYTRQGGYTEESSLVPAVDAKAVAIAHLSSRLSAVAAADSPADQQEK